MFEVITGTLIATLAVVGLAYSFGVGRGLIDRYQIARRALARAELLVDSLGTRKPASLRDSTQTFWFDGTPVGTESWVIQPVDDPIDGTSTSFPVDSYPIDLKQIHVEVTWQVGSLPDSLGLSRRVLAR